MIILLNFLNIINYVKYTIYNTDLSNYFNHCIVIISKAVHTLISFNQTSNPHYRIYTNSKHKIKLLADIGLPMSITVKAGASHERWQFKTTKIIY